MMKDAVSLRVSCLMVTSASRERLGFLNNSIGSYLSQTHENKELVIVVDNHDENARRQLESLVSGLNRSDIRCILPDRKLTLGALRNMSMDNAAGDVFCQWDDDDLSHPARMQAQLKYLTENRLDAALLSDNLHIFPQNGRCYWEHWTRRSGGHPATVMVLRDHGIRYPESGPQSERQEDVNFVRQLKSKCRVGYFEAPPFHYLYFFHGGNTWGFEHHRMLTAMLGVAREEVVSNRESLIRGIQEVRGFELPQLLFMDKKGPLFVWRCGANSITAMENMPAYRSRKLLVIPDGCGMSLVHSPLKSSVTRMQPPVARALSKIGEFKVLDEHALDLCTGQNPALPNAAAAKHMLGEALAAGFLISEDELKKTIMSHDEVNEADETGLSSLGILTYNRPDGLKRCAESFLGNFKRHGRTPRVVVTDDSDLSAAQAANVECLRELNKKYPGQEFLYAGLCDKRSYSEALARHSGIDPGIIEFALFDPERLGQKAGANRNALFLQTVEERFLSVDDDVVCRPAASPGFRDGIGIASVGDPTTVDLYPDRRVTLERCKPVDVDIMSLHEKMLGRRLGTVLRLQAGEIVDFGQMNATLLHRLENGPERIRVTWTGIYGDSGAKYSTYYLWKDNHTQEQITMSDEAYSLLSCSRDIFRAPRRMTVTPGSYCQSTALAFDNRSVLPPFMPVLRGEDIAFGKTLSTCFRRSLIGYLPWAILHAPLEARGNSPEEVISSGRLTPYVRILEALMETFPAPGFAQDEVELMRRLGDYLCLAGRLPAAEFEEIIFPPIWRGTARRIEHLNKHLSGFYGAPARWASDLRGHIEVLNGKLTMNGLRQSLMSLDGAAYEERLALAQRLTVRFGNLLKAWPSLVAAAGELKSRGVTPCRPVHAG